MRFTAHAALLMLALLAGCNLLKGKAESPETAAEKEMRFLMMPLVESADDANLARVAILAVVDTALLQTGEEPDPETAAPAARRERVVIQEVRDSLTENTLIQLISPDQATVDTVRAELSAAGHAGLSSTSVVQIGETMGVDFVITGMIDLAGREVNLVAQETGSGTQVYGNTLEDWPVLIESEEGGGVG